MKKIILSVICLIVLVLTSCHHSNVVPSINTIDLSFKQSILDDPEVKLFISKDNAVNADDFLLLAGKLYQMDILTDTSDEVLKFLKEIGIELTNDFCVSDYLFAWSIADNRIVYYAYIPGTDDKIVVGFYDNGSDSLGFVDAFSVLHEYAYPIWTISTPFCPAS